MKQKDVILQLKLLKSIQPDFNVLQAIKRDVYSHFEIDKRHSLWEHMKYFFSDIFLFFKTRSSFPFSMVAAIVAIVFLSIYTGFLPNEIYKTVLYARISVASNHYIKAAIALSYAQAKIEGISVAGGQLDNNKVNDISHSFALANTELSELKLMGEKGKYTREQCKALYRSYHISLENLNNYITSITPNGENEQSIASLKSQIANYEKEADHKLNLY